MPSDPIGRLVVNGRQIRSTFRYPGGPIIGFVVLERGMLLVHVLKAVTPAALAVAVRFALGCPTVRDSEVVVGSHRYPRPVEQNPAWLAYCGGVPVIGNWRKRDDRIVFDRRTRIAPRPAYLRVVAEKGGKRGR